jgi:hypothetical protein
MGRAPDLDVLDAWPAEAMLFVEAE